MDLSSLPDYPSLQQLAGALWAANGVGPRGAAVLVGAGFSRQADLISATAALPPLWSDLKAALALELYAGRTSHAPSDPLRLAEEYRAQFGQAALNDFVRVRIPDDTWRPSPLHKQLLELPWSDILTTNYDTLIERAARDIIQFQYQPVRFEKELAQARQPRIIKLHGTIGVGDEFILAEEDYRTYPIKHAAFVNVSRQVFIENELCLLGFSGDDPNFLQWSGWVRDNLGGSSRRIYLVGALGLSAPTRKLLESRNVAPIDFAPMLAGVPSADTHREAIKLFLDFLTKSKPSAQHDWHPEQRSIEAPTDEQFRASRTASAAQQRLIDTLPKWRHERNSYPGWLICPHNLRREIRWATESAARDFLFAQELLSIAQRSDVLFEIVWRYETAIWPLPTEILSAIEQCLEADSTLERSRKAQFVLILLREARMRDDIRTYDRWSSAIDAMEGLTPDLRAAATYEKCLAARDRLDLWSAKQLVNELNGSDPVWGLRKASLLAEIADSVGAREAISRALYELRTRELADRKSLWIRSRRAWARWLASGANLLGAQEDSSISAFDALAAADREAKCDPWREVDHLRGLVEDAARERQKRAAEELVPQFEPGAYRDNKNTTYFESHVVSEPWQEITRIQEIVGIPYRFENTAMLSVACESLHIAPKPTTRWHILLIRAIWSYKSRYIDWHLGRIAIARLPLDVAEQCGTLIRNALSNWCREARKTASEPHIHVYIIDAVRSLMVALCRFTPRLDLVNVGLNFNLAVEIGEQPELRDIWLTGPLGSLLRHSLEAMTPELRSSVALACLKFPISSEARISHKTDPWPNPFVALRTTEIRRPAGDSQWTNRIQELLKLVRSKGDSRTEAVIRLHHLNCASALSVAESMTFAEALWSEVDAVNPPLPADTSLYWHVFKQLPAPEGVNIRDTLRKRLHSPEHGWLSNPLLLTSIACAARSPDPILPTSDTAFILLDEIVKMANTNTPASDIQEDLKEAIGGVISLALAPVLTTTQINTSYAEAFIDLVEREELHHASRGCVHFAQLHPTLCDRVSNLLSIRLVGNSWRAVSCSADAIEMWAGLGKSTAAPIPDPLIESLIGAIEARRTVGQAALLSGVQTLVNAGNLKASHLERLARALILVTAESAYENVTPQSEQAITASLLRRECVELIDALLDKVDARYVPPLRTWLEQAANDPLPEVRFALLNREK